MNIIVDKIKKIGFFRSRFICCIVLVAVLVMGFLCSTLSVFAISYFPQTVTVNNISNVSFGQFGIIYGEQSDIYSFSSIFGQSFNCNYPSRDIDNNIVIITVQNGSIDGIPMDYSDIPDGSYYAVFQCYVEGGNAVIVPNPQPDSFAYVNYNDTFTYIYLDSSIDNSLILGTSEDDISSAGCIKLVPVDSEPPSECPSLQVQINQFTGSYNEFEGMLLGSVNDTIYQGYRNKLQEMYRDGVDSVTLEQLLADYDGSFQQLITLLSENNLRLLDEYADYIEEQRTQSYNDGYAQGNEVGFNDGYAQGNEEGFNDGYAQGNEKGFNDGYSRGYNKASSEQFGETLLGDTFNMPLNALNNWVLFETSTGIDVTMGGLVTGLLALSILIILIKMFAGG